MGYMILATIALFVLGVFTCDYKWEQRLYDDD